MSGVSETIDSRVWEKSIGESGSQVLLTPKEGKCDSRVQEKSIVESGSQVLLTPKEKKQLRDKKYREKLKLSKELQGEKENSKEKARLCRKQFWLRMKESEEFKEKERDRKRLFYNTNLDDCKAKNKKYFRKEDIAEKHRTAMRCRMGQYFVDEEMHMSKGSL